MEFDRIRFMEHLAVDCPLSLWELCERMQQQFSLPEFSFDSENETEWGLVEHDGIQYNVSRPYKRYRLSDWDGTVPYGCNFGITLMVSSARPPEQDIDWSGDNLVPNVGQRLAVMLGRRVFHHRTWVRVGENVARQRVFYPPSQRKQRH
jgi:hypothetical protein